jgi:hypothetical protein
MRAICFALLLTLTSTCLLAEETASPPYHSDPNHLWNRVYTQLAVRTFDNVQYGVDIAEPYPDPFDSPQQLVTTLDEFLSPKSQRALPSGDLRALLLNDIWTAFDVAVALPNRSPALELRLAQAVHSLRMTAGQLAELGDNYAAAIKTGRFAREFDPKHPQIAFLPPDLFDPRGAWVEVGGGGRGSIAPLHVRLVSGRSTFSVFIRCPGGRQETLSYLARLNLYPSPWQLNPDPIGTSYPNNQKVRMNVLQPDPNTPQLPRGTMVALVRRMMAIDDHLELKTTPIIQKVQIRVYGSSDDTAGTVGQLRQHVYEFVMRRKDLTAHVAGGLHAVSRDEREYQALLVPVDRNSASYFGGYVVFSTCAGCHTRDGILSVRSYLGAFDAFPANPQLLPAASADDQSAATIRWKEMQFNWGLLQGILARQPVH